MAGGSGKRLWPLSRQDMPKQLLKVVGGKSLLRIAYERLAGIVPPEAVLVCTGADYAERGRGRAARGRPGEHPGRAGGAGLAERGGLAGRRAGRPRPRRRGRGGHRRPDHAPGVGVPGRAGRGLRPGRGASRRAGHLRGGADLTAHRLRLPAPRGRRCPVTPTSAAVVEFKEKPDLATARSTWPRGEYWWNSGMFVWRARTLLDQLARAAAADPRGGDRAGRRTRAAGRDLSPAAQDQRRLRGHGAGVPGPGDRRGRRRPAAHHLARRRRVRRSGRAVAPGRPGQRARTGSACWSMPATTW